MDVVDLLRDLGGVARRRSLLSVIDRASLERAVEAGVVVRVGRGVFGLPGVDTAREAACVLGGVVSHASAAWLHGWGLAAAPRRPHVTVSRGRVVSPTWRDRVEVHCAELGPGDIVDGMTDERVTLLGCLRTMPFPEALAVADSALREGLGRGVLDGVAEDVRGPGSPRVRRVCAEATALAANPFESVLRAHALEVGGLRVRPQVDLPGLGVRPDLVDERLRVVLEADSFEWHGGRAALAADARRYNAMVVDGWLVLRFSYEQVMGDAPGVLTTLRRAVALAELLNEVPPTAPGQAAVVSRC